MKKGKEYKELLKKKKDKENEKWIKEVERDKTMKTFWSEISWTKKKKNKISRKKQ